MAGERFAVRNSGVTAVVEGIGDHGCEYMTGGLVVILGDTGKNFAAGMSGGVAYVYDAKKEFKDKCNMEMVEFDKMSKADHTTLQTLVRNHFSCTSSNVALDLLNDWEKAKKRFIKVMPTDYKRVLEKNKNNKKSTIKRTAVAASVKW